MGRGGAISHPPALTGPGGPGRRSGRRRRSVCRGCGGCPRGQQAAGPERSRSGSGTTPGRPPRRRSRPAGCSRHRCCYAGRHGVSVGLRPAASHADLPGLGHSPVCSPFCSGPTGGSASGGGSRGPAGGWARGLGPRDVHAVAEVEPIQGVDVLPGKVVQRPQGAAGWVRPGGRARVGGSGVRARPRVPTTATCTAGRATLVPTALTRVSRRAERPPSPTVLSSLGGGSESGAVAAEGTQTPGLPAPPTVDPTTLWLVHGPSLSLLWLPRHLECCPAPFSGGLPFWKVPRPPPPPWAAQRLSVPPGWQWSHQDSAGSSCPLACSRGTGLGKASRPRWGLPL